MRAPLIPAAVAQLVAGVTQVLGEEGVALAAGSAGGATVLNHAGTRLANMPIQPAGRAHMGVMVLQGRSLSQRGSPCAMRSNTL